MAKLNIPRMTKSAEECLGWPYVSPGSNDSRGIDCSGLFVKIYKDQGASIYHGSNTIYRKYCGDKGKLTSAKQLCEGMAVFKWNPNTPEKFDDGLGDFQHIGYVAGVNPLRIIHASTGTMCVTTDTKIGKWAYWGKLKDVDYEDSGDDSDPDEGGDNVYKATLQGGNIEKPINIRVQPDGALQDTVPQGTVVTVLSEEKNWCKVRYPKGKGTRTGYVMGQYVEAIDEDDPIDGDIPDEPDEDEDWGSEKVVLSFTATAKQAAIALPVLEKLVEAIIDQVGRG